ncbi:hypothetical protein KQI42_08315 [Tissierella sp. MSJ-40]|uniref:DUF523 domain-containing protein n=1 Tax=Tissierella simiarum TaxID=2841534 RepID=A0ABS6E704_9FIRM|nr:CD3072 family TudS-related putative desulfidase [Tissierella simiarum]MBU5438008.1 hypothetical protein [Tissierella simiarum]
MERNRKILMVCHCILNSNSKVEGLSQYKGMFKEVIDIINEEDIGIIQLPCPETIVYGIRRWGHVKEQFDTLFYRESCREMIKPIVNQVKSYIDAGYEILGVLGIDGSPSCGVNLTCSGDWRGELSTNNNLEEMIKDIKYIEGSGVFIEELQKYFMEYGIKIPFIAIDERNVYDSLSNIRKFIANK